MGSGSSSYHRHHEIGIAYTDVGQVSGRRQLSYANLDEKGDFIVNKEKCSNFLYRIDNIANKIEKMIEWVACILLVVLVLAVISSILTRNMNIPIVWLGELGTFSFLWVTFFSMALAYRHNLFPNVDIINRFVAGKGAQLLSLYLELIVMAFLGIVLWSARDFMTYLASSGHVSAEMRIPMVYVYIGPVLGYVLTLFFSIVNMCGKIITLKYPEISVGKEVRI